MLARRALPSIRSKRANQIFKFAHRQAEMHGWTQPFLLSTEA